MPSPLPEGDPNSDIPGARIWGWMHDVELKWLMKTAKTMSSVCEVGSLHGRSAFALLTACKGPVYCIDPWDDPGEHCIKSFMGSCGHFENLRPIKGYSPQVADQIPDVDMTFIDGAHDRASVEADINCWLAKTNKLLCGHDYNDDPDIAGFPDVGIVVREIFGDRFKVAPGTSIWTVRL